MNTSAANGTIIGVLPYKLLPYCVFPVQTECIVAMWLWKVVPVALLAFGTIGNILSLSVLSRRRMRVHTISIYLMFLAVSDLAFMYSSIIRMTLLRLSDYDLRNMSLIVCMFQQWLSYTSAGFSAWLLVFVTVERTIYIAWPLKAKRKITRKNAVVSSILLLLMMALFAGYIPFAFKMKEVNEKETRANETVVIKTDTVCVAEDNAVDTFRTGLWTILNRVFLNITPTVLIFTGDVIAALALYLQNRKRKSMVGRETLSALDAKRAAAAKMLMFLCSFFLVTTTPYIIFPVIKTVFFSATDNGTYARLQLAHAVAYIMLSANFSFNFWLYFVSGSLFKSEWKMMMTSLIKRCNCCVNRLTNADDNENNVGNEE